MGRLWDDHGALTGVLNNAAANFIAPTESLSPRAFDAMDGGQMLAGPGTFAGLTSLTAEDWAEAREKSRAATAASKAQRA
jgi:hypothetical protein